MESLTSIELIFHTDTVPAKQWSIPLRLRFKHSHTLVEIFVVDIYLHFDSNRDFYSANILPYFPSLVDHDTWVIESVIHQQTCQTSQTYMIVSSRRIQFKFDPNLALDFRSLTQPADNAPPSVCRLQTIQIKFEDLGLAYLIIRPKEYLYTYCEGSCASTKLQPRQQPSFHALFQSMVRQKNPAIPQPTCAPSQMADDTFLLRQSDGSIELYPIKDMIVKQCACL